MPNNRQQWGKDKGEGEEKKTNEPKEKRRQEGEREKGEGEEKNGVYLLCITLSRCWEVSHELKETNRSVRLYSSYPCPNNFHPVPRERKRTKERGGGEREWEKEIRARGGGKKERQCTSRRITSEVTNDSSSAPDPRQKLWNKERRKLYTSSVREKKQFLVKEREKRNARSSWFQKEEKRTKGTARSHLLPSYLCNLVERRRL